ncbi:hypothetical protein ILYODFUR_018583 [Ilyodon furcidens]|uniref:Secreted protein n=1 Tax=Ilyodon furcidens TaxID=33524 RepID=A0ABV0TAA3_9TELE
MLGHFRSCWKICLMLNFNIGFLLMASHLFKTDHSRSQSSFAAADPHTPNLGTRLYANNPPCQVISRIATSPHKPKITTLSNHPCLL